MTLMKRTSAFGASVRGPPKMLTAMPAPVGPTSSGPLFVSRSLLSLEGAE